MGNYNHNMLFSQVCIFSIKSSVRVKIMDICHASGNRKDTHLVEVAHSYEYRWGNHAGNGFTEGMEIPA